MRTYSSLGLFALAALAVSCSDTFVAQSPLVTTQLGYLRPAQSCPDLEGALKDDAKFKLNRQIDAMVSMLDRYGYAYNGGYATDAKGGPLASPEASGGTAPPRDSNTSANPTSPGGSGSQGASATVASTTNTQVKGVDEADIVKNDTKYIYILHGDTFRVIDAWPAASMSSVDRWKASIEGTPSEMFVDNGRVVIYSTVVGDPIYRAAGKTPRQNYTDQYYGYVGVGVPRSAGVPTPVEPPVAGSAGSTDAGAAVPSTDNPVSTEPAPPAPPTLRPDERGPSPYYGSTLLTKITVLTVNDAGVSVMRESYFEGNYLSSRRVGDYVRTVLTGSGPGPVLSFDPGTTTMPQTVDEAKALLESVRKKNLAAIDASKVEDWMPYTFEKRDGAVSASVPACDSFYVPSAGSTQYGLVQIPSFDLSKPKDPIQGQTIVGTADVVYSNEASLVLAAHAWIDPYYRSFPVGTGRPETTEPSVVSVGGSSGSASSGGGTATPSTTTPPDAPTAGADAGPRLSPSSLRPLTAAEPPATPVTLSWTHLHAFDLRSNPAKPAYVGSGSVPGSVHNQFSLDEAAGTIRVMTTEQRAAWGTNAEKQSGEWNHLHTLKVGKTLDIIGSVKDLAHNERIYSARFVGNRGYMVTFRQTDPLFVLDLSDPRSPLLLGQTREIPGFSEYIHPLDENHLLTIGRHTDSNGRSAGLALQIFDVTNPVQVPDPIHKFIFAGSDYGYSEAEQNHKAFTYFAEKKLLSIPYYAYGSNGGAKSTLEIFAVDLTTGFKRLGSVDHSKYFETKPYGYCGGYFSPLVRRGVFLDNVAYSISFGGIIASEVTAKDVRFVSELSLPAPTVDASYCTGGGGVEPASPPSGGGGDTNTEEPSAGPSRE